MFVFPRAVWRGRRGRMLFMQERSTTRCSTARFVCRSCYDLRRRGSIKFSERSFPNDFSCIICQATPLQAGLPLIDCGTQRREVFCSPLPLPSQSALGASYCRFGRSWGTVGWITKRAVSHAGARGLKGEVGRDRLAGAAVQENLEMANTAVPLSSKKRHADAALTKENKAELELHVPLAGRWGDGGARHTRNPLPTGRGEAGSRSSRATQGRYTPFRSLPRYPY